MAETLMDRRNERTITPKGGPRIKATNNSDAKADSAILHPGGNDVMFGRGGDTNYHVGNNRFRTLVAEKYRLRYQEAKSRKEKSRIAMEVIQHWRNKQDPPGRFLARHQGDGTWYEVGHDVALKKAMKVLGEKNTKAQKAKQEQKQQQQQQQLANVQLQPLQYSNTLQQPGSRKQQRDPATPKQNQQAVSQSLLTHHQQQQQQPNEPMVASLQLAIAQKKQLLPSSLAVSTTHAQHLSPVQESTNETIQELRLEGMERLVQGISHVYPGHQGRPDGPKPNGPDCPHATNKTNKTALVEAQRQSAAPQDAEQLPSAAELTNIFDKDAVSGGSSDKSDSYY